jgi:hypothetical protein
VYADGGPGLAGVAVGDWRAIGAAANHRFIDLAWGTRLARQRDDPEAELPD